MINALKKFFGSEGVQMSANVQNNSSSSSAITIKSEPVYVAEETNVVRQYEKDAGREERSECGRYHRDNYGRQERTNERQNYKMLVLQLWFNIPLCKLIPKESI